VPFSLSGYLSLSGALLFSLFDRFSFFLSRKPNRSEENLLGCSSLDFHEDDPARFYHQLANDKWQELVPQQFQQFASVLFSDACHGPKTKNTVG